MRFPFRKSGKTKTFDLVVVCLLGAFLSTIVAFIHSGRNTDFKQFYTAAKLAGAGHIYDWAKIRQGQVELQGDPMPYLRPPFHAAAFKVFAAMPPLAARVAWGALNLAALAAFLFVWPFPGGRRAAAAQALCWSFPAAILMSVGQDTALFLLLAAAGFRLLASNRDFLAGLMFALCAGKFHLALPIPVLLAARRSWSAIAGGAVGGAILLALSFWVEGLSWPQRFLALTKVREINTAQTKMPNLNGLVQWLPWGGIFEVVLALAALVLVYRIAARSTLEVGAAAALAAGLMTSHHAYVYDAVLLIPLLVLAMAPDFSRWMRVVAFALLTPFLYYMLLEDSLSLGAHLLLTPGLFAILWVLAFRQPQDRAARLV